MLCYPIYWLFAFLISRKTIYCFTPLGSSCFEPQQHKCDALPPCRAAIWQGGNSFIDPWILKYICSLPCYNNCVTLSKLPLIPKVAPLRINSPHLSTLNILLAFLHLKDWFSFCPELSAWSVFSSPNKLINIRICMSYIFLITFICIIMVCLQRQYFPGFIFLQNKPVPYWLLASKNFSQWHNKGAM